MSVVSESIIRDLVDAAFKDSRAGKRVAVGHRAEDAAEDESLTHSCRRCC
jgi:ATP-dependent protease HslVU (ClpYQ) ATPase subunit